MNQIVTHMTRRNLLSGLAAGIAALCGWKGAPKYIVTTIYVVNGCMTPNEMREWERTVQ